MLKLDARVKSLEELWSFDKELLKKYNPDLPVDWNAPLPTDEEGYILLIQRQERWKNPSSPLKINKKSLNQIISRSVPFLKSAWQCGLEVLGDIDFEILEQADYMPRIDELQRAVNNKFGYGDEIKSPPAMFLCPTFKKLIMPDEFLVRNPKKNQEDLRGYAESSMNSSDFDVECFRWDAPFLEEVLNEEISHAVYRQTRGEWGEDYVRTMLAIGPEKEQIISLLNEIIALCIKERIAQSKPEQGLYVVADRISSIWGNSYARGIYLAIDSFSLSKPLSQIALLDFFSFNHKYVFADFFPEHPFNSEKQEKFWAE